MEYPDSYIITARACCKKGGHCGRWACKINAEKAESLWKYIFRMGRLGI